MGSEGGHLVGVNPSFRPSQSETELVKASHCGDYSIVLGVGMRMFLINCALVNLSSKGLPMKPVCASVCVCMCVFY